VETLTLQVVPSMLDVDQARLADELADLEAAGADRVQWDIMDGSFVPRITHGADPIKAVRKASGLAFEAHLMVDRPEAQRPGLREGGAITPATPLTAVADVLDLVDDLLVMTVNPGRGGQKFITSMLAKLSDARGLIDDEKLVIDLEVDGGVSAETAPMAGEAGANLLVAGSAVNRHAEGRRRAIDEIRAEGMRGWRRRLKLRAEAGVSVAATEGGGDGLARGVE